MNIDEYSWPALSWRTEIKTGKIKTFLLPDLTTLFWVKLLYQSQSSSKQMEQTGKNVFLAKLILPKRCDIPDLLRCNNVM